MLTSRWAAPPSAWQRFVAGLAGRREDIGFRKPYGVTTDSRGRILVTDTGWGQVLVFDKEEGEFSWLGDHGQGALAQPSGITTDPEGHVYVSDMGQSVVMEYGPDHAFIGLRHHRTTSPRRLKGLPDEDYKYYGRPPESSRSLLR